MGFARLRCDTCRRERLLTFSCRTRQLWPSRGAKRGVIFGAFLREEVVEPVGHAQWVFTIPKILAHLAKVAAAGATEGSGPGPARLPPPGPPPDPSVN